MKDYKNMKLHKRHPDEDINMPALVAVGALAVIVICVLAYFQPPPSLNPVPSASASAR